MTTPAIGMPPDEAGHPEPRPVRVRVRPAAALLEPTILRRAALRAVVKLDPRLMIKKRDRVIPIILALAIAGSLAGARVHARTRATLDTAGPTFGAFLVGVIVIVGGLIYFPMLILGPIGERIVG
ncbi:MAG TPA: potassium-transporting ATPase subunit KdpA [Trebonia sp.]|nr:potassium-transporting ATPase subunit KdpA [Trebonia sp.]